MNEFVSIEILGTIAGCSAVITLLTQVFKKYLPEKYKESPDLFWEINFRLGVMEIKKGNQ